MEVPNGVGVAIEEEGVHFYQSNSSVGGEASSTHLLLFKNTLYVFES